MSRYKQYVKIKEKGVARIKVYGQVHQCMKKLTGGPLRANQLRRNNYHMSEMEKCLVMGFIQRDEGVYSLTEQGRSWLKQLDLAAEFGERYLSYPVTVNEEWLEYFRRHIW